MKAFPPGPCFSLQEMFDSLVLHYHRWSGSRSEGDAKCDHEKSFLDACAFELVSWMLTDQAVTRDSFENWIRVERLITFQWYTFETKIKIWRIFSTFLVHLRSLLQSLRHAKDHAPQIHFEWHILDDATERSDLKKKNDMINDLVERKWVANYTRLDRHSGTVRALRHVVDTFLSRVDLDLFFHCDDDILMGETTLSRAVLDYVTDLSKDFTNAGGVLALFVNSWLLGLKLNICCEIFQWFNSLPLTRLDEQLSVSTGSYATAPFLGGASYVVDRATLAQKNPWKEALQQGRSTPHEAHVFWLREMLPQQKLKIWIRWKKPYECQHLGNVTWTFSMKSSFYSLIAVLYITWRR